MYWAGVSRTRRYLVPRFETEAAAIVEGRVPITEEPLAQSLLDNLMET
jgi:hypothetical protein